MPDTSEETLKSWNMGWGYRYGTVRGEAWAGTGDAMALNNSPIPKEMLTMKWAELGLGLTEITTKLCKMHMTFLMWHEFTGQWKKSEV